LVYVPRQILTAFNESKAKQEHIWISVEGDAEDIFQVIAPKLQLHPLTVEDCLVKNMYISSALPNNTLAFVCLIVVDDVMMLIVVRS
jgi:Mg2+ and Co2+ transporter CorA